MDNNKYVELLYKKENELIKICKFHNFHDPFDIDDIIQNLYIKLLTLNDINKYVNEDNLPNMYIIFIILKNMIYDFRKKQQKINVTNITEAENITEDKTDYEKHDFILNEISKINYWFDREIIILYVTQQHTIRSLSKETKIGFSTIQKIVHSFKIQCQNNYNQKHDNSVF